MEKIIDEMITKYQSIEDNYESNPNLDCHERGVEAGKADLSWRVVEDLEQLKSSLPKPVEVPEVVGSFLYHGNKNDKIAYLISCKHNIITCDMAEGELKQWLREVSMDDLLSLANGYTVVKEPLYYVRLKNTILTDANHCYLWLNQSTNKVFFEQKNIKWTNEGNVKNTFTEKEIAEISDGVFVDNKAFEVVPVGETDKLPQEIEVSEYLEEDAE